MRAETKRRAGRLKRRRRIRGKVSGTPQRPRLTVFKSLRHIYAQVVNDVTGNTLLAVSTASTVMKEKLKSTRDCHAAEIVGEMIGEGILKRGIKTIVFDRNGYQYHGKIKALADKVREKGIEF